MTDRYFARKEQYSLSDVRKLFEELSNWRRWGENDQLGTANHISSSAVVAAAKLVKKGKVISCGLAFDQNGPQKGDFGRYNPMLLMLQDGGDAESGSQDHLKGLRYADDAIFMPLQSATQWDGLAHVFFEGKMYNGYPLEEVTSKGATRNGIEHLAATMVGRGVLLDIPRYLGRDWLDDGEAISPEQLDECALAQNVVIGQGDIVLIRTGQLAHVRSRGDWGDYTGGDAPGLSIRTAPWFAEKQVAAYATDTWGTEVLPNETAEVFQPLHVIMLVGMGMIIGEMFDLERLAEDCASDGIYEFLFSATPLPITGAVGSPINPVAIK